jgi:rubredoxin
LQVLGAVAAVGRLARPGNAPTRPAQTIPLQDISADYQCPICGSPKDKFDSRVTVVAGFAANQGYGLGSNSMTEGQKSALIYGTLVLFFVLFLAGYAMD